MALIINFTNAATALKSNTVDVMTKTDRAASMFESLSNYTAPGGSAMPNFSWVAPTGHSFEFSTSNGEIFYRGGPYSSLQPDDKRDFFIWIDKFVKRCIQNYNDTYSL